MLEESSHGGEGGVVGEKDDGENVFEEVSGVEVSCRDHGACGGFSPQEDLTNPFLPLEKLGKLLLEPSLPNNTNTSSHHPLFNFSIHEAYDIISDTQAGYLDGVTEVVFIVCYVSLILFGVGGNMMVGWVIWRKRTMRTPRNLYIINLTVSDLSMCLVCMPVTLVGLLYKNWGMGSLACKLVPVLQGANIMVSTSTVVAIAVDRYATIVKAGGSTRNKFHVAASICAIWVSSVLFALPLYFYYIVAQVKLQHILLYSRCVDHWPSRSAKNVWIIALLLTQYGIPIVVLSVVHARIKRYLSQHMMGQYDARRAQKEIERNRKTTILLSTIAVAFAVCWLPWNIVNLLADFEYEGFKDPTHLYTVFGACHMIAMSSACINPVLYGWLNTNLRRELLEFLPPIFAKMGWILPESFRRRTGDSPTRQPESVTLLVFQGNQNNSIQTVAHPPQTITTTIIKDDT
ncbi:neuropeptide Y receptor type 6-like [Homarus americanus]|uniref:neuropeptide Y receptor type 6-like n=1 Tax=Homarus americanus TaxID=6706 RepID=UPI001C44BCA6|nr:neuropeptide Y receptor type 6-like [Homarus americanus]